jgi:WD40 repeat protein
MDFSTTSDCLAAGCWDMFAKLWRLADSSLFELTPQHPHNVDYVHFMKDDRVLLTATDQTVWLWSVEDRTLLKRVSFNPLEQTWSHILGGIGSVLFSVSDWGVLRVTDTDDWKSEEYDLRFKKHVRALDYSDKHQILAIGLADGRILLWSFPKRKVVGRARIGGDAVMSLSFTPNGDQLAAVYAWDENNVVVIDISTCL